MKETETTWDGVYVRDNLGESGTMPKSANATSPDIICAGNFPFENPGQLKNEDNYSNAYENKVYANAWNYIYMRGKNYAAETREGVWQCYYVPSNIILLPVMWKSNKMATSNGDKNPAFRIEPGEIGASEDCFVWKAEPLPPDQHYCLVGYTKTTEHGDSFLNVSKITDWAKILHENGNLAQRNVNLIYSNTPTYTGVAGYNQGSEEAKMDIVMLFKNIPTGSKIHAGFSQPLKGKTLKYENNSTDDIDFKYGWPDLDIPAQWIANFNFTIWLGDEWTGITERPSIEIRGEIIQDLNDPLYYLGVDAVHPVTGKKRLNKNGGPMKVVKVGSVKSVCANVIIP